MQRETHVPVDHVHHGWHRRWNRGNRAWNQTYNSQSQSQPPDSADAPTELYPLVPNLLLLNKEIYAETQQIFYGGNAFLVEDTTTLHAFLATIGPKNCASLFDLTIKGWGYTKAHKALNYPSLTMLSSAVNLKHLHIDCVLGWKSGGAGSAKQLYRDGFHWLEAVAIAHGRFDAAMDIVNIRKEHVGSPYGRPKISDEENLELFKEELRKLLRRSPGLPGAIPQWER